MFTWCRASATLVLQEPPFTALPHLALSESFVYYIAMFSTEMKDSPRSNHQGAAARDL